MRNHLQARPSRRALRSLLVAGLLVLPMGCGGSGDGQPATSLAAVKSDAWRTLIGQEFSVEGHIMIHDNGTALLVTSPADISANTLIPESNYLALTGPAFEGLTSSEHYMDRVRVTGVVQETIHASRRHLVEIAGDVSLCELSVSEPLTVVVLWPAGPAPVDVSCLPTGVCEPEPTDPRKFALLYSGGIHYDKAYKRYWNDIWLYHIMLTTYFGYDPDNIIVVYKDGYEETGAIPPPGSLTVDFPATPDGLEAAFSTLGRRMTGIDEFFFFMTNHGGTVKDAGSPTPGDEWLSSDTTDECSFYYGVKERLYDDRVAELVNGLRFSRMCCVMEQCFSGGMIHDLRGPNRVIVTACSEHELSYGNAFYDEFALLFASALIGFNQFNGVPVNSDLNNDGRVTVYEAFRWASENDTQPETPQYEDNGNGIPTASPIVGVTSDGSFGATYFL